ncbi:hypothetical protein [Streptomyces sp. NPDC002587]
MKHIKVGDLMTDEVVSVVTSASFKDVAKLLAQHDISGLRWTAGWRDGVRSRSWSASPDRSRAWSRSRPVPRLSARADDSPLTPPSRSAHDMPW